MATNNGLNLGPTPLAASLGGTGGSGGATIDAGTLAKAFTTFNTSTGLSDFFNCSSIADQGGGVYRITFDTAIHANASVGLVGADSGSVWFVSAITSTYFDISDLFVTGGVSGCAIVYYYA